MYVPMLKQKNALDARIKSEPPYTGKEITVFLTPKMINFLCELLNQYPYKDPFRKFEFEHPTIPKAKFSTFKLADLGHYPAGTLIMGHSLVMDGACAVRTVTAAEAKFGILPIEQVDEIRLDRAQFEKWCEHEAITIASEKDGVRVVQASENQRFALRMRWK